MDEWRKNALLISGRYAIKSVKAVDTFARGTAVKVTMGVDGEEMEMAIIVTTNVPEKWYEDEAYQIETAKVVLRSADHYYIEALKKRVDTLENEVKRLKKRRH